VVASTEAENLPGPGPQTQDRLGIYVHIPFCSAICNYCNFNRGLYDEALKTRYVDALIRQISSAPHASRPADTVYFGGGTPSLLDPAEVRAIIAAVRDRFALDADAEITLETNPETVDGAKLERFRGAGVNRLSLGVQSFHDEELRRLGRIHSAERARGAVRDARAAGFDNVSLDLMMWLPGQSVASWLASVDRLIDAEPDHASLYLLELYPNAPLKEDMARAGWSLAPDDDAAVMYLTAMDRLERTGLRQYEISNVARPGRESRHNLKYWADGEWVGFGCGAHSTVGAADAASGQAGVRWKNVAGTVEYVDRVHAGMDLVTDRRVLTRQERLEEALFTGLRLNAGVDLEAMSARYAVDVWARYGRALHPFVEREWLVHEPPRLRLTREGMLMANEVMAVFV
jgi:oxygen-independent coproporphyrinogen III oxidase